MNAYTGTIDVDGVQRVVEILHVGRVALVYQTSDGEETGYWNKQERRWEVLDDSFKAAVRTGIRMAKQQAGMNLLPVPVLVEGLIMERKHMNRTSGLVIVALGGLLAGSAFAQEELSVEDALEVVEANTLDDLLKNVEERRVVENQENIRRENEFRAQRDRQSQLLDQARENRRQERLRGERLDTEYRENERLIGELQDQYNQRLGKLRELFGVLQQVAGDTRSHFDESVVSLQYPGRGEWLGELAAKMGSATQLATIDEMEELWEHLQREATESGKVARFTVPVDQHDGDQVDTEVVRVGSFAVISEEGYLNYDWDLDRLVQLGRQPEAQFANTAENLFEADTG